MTRDLRNPDFCREFILASLDKGLSLQKVLGKVVRSYGIKEFAKLIKMAPPNLIRAINPKHNPSNEFESSPPFSVLFGKNSYIQHNSQIPFSPPLFYLFFNNHGALH